MELLGSVVASVSLIVCLTTALFACLFCQRIFKLKGNFWILSLSMSLSCTNPMVKWFWRGRLWFDSRVGFVWKKIRRLSLLVVFLGEALHAISAALSGRQLAIINRTDTHMQWTVVMGQIGQDTMLRIGTKLSIVSRAPPQKNLHLVM